MKKFLMMTCMMFSVSAFAEIDTYNPYSSGIFAVPSQVRTHSHDRYGNLVVNNVIVPEYRPNPIPDVRREIEQIHLENKKQQNDIRRNIKTLQNQNDYSSDFR